ncbi:MAG: AAA family ATPase [Polyangiales bacterium]
MSNDLRSRRSQESAKRPLVAAGGLTYGFDDYEFDPDALSLRRLGRSVPLNPRSAALLECLVRRAGQLVTKRELIDRVWHGRPATDEVIIVSMARLRHLLGQQRDGRPFFAAKYGQGYRFVCPVVQRSAAELGSRLPFSTVEHTLRRLDAAFTAARGGHGSACVVFGEPDVGKSYVLDTFTRRVAALAPEGAQLYTTRATLGAPPLRPWLELLRGAMRTMTEPSLARELGPAAASGMLAICRDDASTRQNELHGQRRFWHFDAIVRTLAHAASTRPLVLAIEDLQHADVASLELMHQLLGDIARTNIMLVVALRYTEHEPQRTAALMHVLGHANCQRLQLIANSAI